jgi:hypothetical protein
MDPSYIIIHFQEIPPAGYRGWLDEANHFIGGSAPRQHAFNVGVNNNERITFVDPTLSNISFLQVDSRANADYVSGLLRGNGLHSWVMESKTPALWR